MSEHQPNMATPQAEETLFRRLVEQAPTGMAVLRDNRFVFVNEPHATLYGYTAADMLGQSWRILYLPEEIAHIEQSVFPELTRVGHWRGEVRGKRKDGSTIATEIRLFADPDGTMTCHCRDISRAKADELELARKSAELERAARMRDQFLASMSHELRTPLAGILGLSEVLRDGIYGELTQPQTDAVRAIEQSGHHLLDLINDILDLSKIESGHVELERQPVNMAELSAAAVRFIRSPASKKCIATSLVVDPPDLVADLDPKRFKQILVNLLDNAIKFTPVGGRVDARVQRTEDGEHIELSVTDNGRGIDSADFRRIFLPFEQVDRHLARNVNGAGLGLPLVLRLAELHGGGVSVRSSIGQGSCFTVTLPGHCESAPPATPTETAPNPHPPESCAPATPTTAARIAVVEDNPVTSRILVDYLTNRGFHCLPLLESSTALARLRDFAPDAILMDIQMPVIDGFELAGLVRTCGDPHLASVPVIALTALAMSGDRERCLQSGMNDYMAKPFRLNEVHETLCRFIHESTRKTL